MARINIGATVAIATESNGTTPDPQTTDLDTSSFAALSYTTVPNVITHGDTGMNQNFVTTQTWDNRIADQNKGAATGQQADIVILDESSNGRTAMDAAGDITDDNAYAFKITYSDGSIEYGRAKVGAPSYSKGGNEDVAQITYPTIAVQEPVFA